MRGRDSLPTATERAGFEQSRDDRQRSSTERQSQQLERGRIADERAGTATARDRTATERDGASSDWDAVAEKLTAAAAERTKLLLEQARLEAELKSAYRDDLTGAYRREVGRSALTHEIARARRSDGRFVVAFVDVDRLKQVNDRDGHAAGDEVLRTVVSTIRSRLRSFDPIVRYGGDEFLCGLGGTDIEEAERRFDSIGVAIEAAAGVGISVGLAALTGDETADELAARADFVMLEAKARRHAHSSSER